MSKPRRKPARKPSLIPWWKTLRPSVLDRLTPTELADLILSSREPGALNVTLSDQAQAAYLKQLARWAHSELWSPLWKQQNREKPIECDPSDGRRRSEELDPLPYLELALSMLSEDEAQILVLKHVDGMTLEEIADGLKRSQGSVWNVLTRARERARTILLVNLRRDERS